MKSVRETQLASDPLVQARTLLQFHDVPTVTREPFRTTGRIRRTTRRGNS